MPRDIMTAKHGHVMTVTLNNPPANLIQSDIMKNLGKAIEKATRDDDVSIVVVTGGPKVFSEGVNEAWFRDLGAKEKAEFVRTGQEVVLNLENLPKPTMAAMAGKVMDAGLEIALACDLRLAGDDAQFGHQELAKGIIPLFGNTYRLERLVGRSRARALIYFGEPIPAWEALEIGLVGKIAPKDMVLEEARISAARIATQPFDALVAAKKAMLGVDDEQCKVALENVVKSFGEEKKRRRKKNPKE